MAFSFISPVTKLPFMGRNYNHSATVMTLPPNNFQTPSKGLGIVITGSTKGVGRALAESFLTYNDSVIVTSRDPGHVEQAIVSIQALSPGARVFGFVGDVGNHEDVRRLATYASETLGVVHAIICNAGTVGARTPLLAADPSDMKAVVQTNLLGSMYCAKEAMRIASKQKQPLHVFLMDGSGTLGNSTPEYAAYGATKRSIPQLVLSLSAEAKDTNVRFHTLSPGMVLTDLLLGGNSSPKVRKMFNILAEEPETVSEQLVPQIRSVVQTGKSNTYIKFLTIPKAFYRLSTGFLLGFRKNLFFDEVSGNRVDSTGRYNENGVRLKK